MHIAKSLALFLVLYAGTTGSAKLPSSPEQLQRLPDSEWWTAFGGNDAHTGYKAQTLGSLNSSRELWSVNATTGTFSAPVVYNGMVFVMTSDGVLRALDEASGTLVKLWNLGGGSDIGPPTIGHNGLLYVQYVGSSAGIKLFAVDVKTLRPHWTATAASQWANYPFGVASSKTTGLVYFPGGQYDGMMYAVNAENGTQVFQSSLFPTSSGTDTWAPAVSEDKRVFFSAGAGGGNDGMIGEVDNVTGKVLWSLKLNSAWIGYNTNWVPNVYKNTALATVYSSNSIISVLAADIDSHTALWTTDTCQLSSSNQDVTSATDGSNVFLACYDGVYTYNFQTGLPGRVYKPCKQCFGQPIVLDDHLFVRSPEGVLSFEKATGKLVKISTQTAKHIAYHDKKLFVASGATLTAYHLIAS